MKIKKPKEKLLVFALGAIIVGVMTVFELPCPFKWAFGVDCLGCGITRAYISLFKLDINGAFEFNPMFWSVPILALMYLLDGNLFKSRLLNHLALGLILFGFFACWIAKLLV